ncbi:MAG: hypothetical protein ACT4TC_11770, partial [Myxococcaceae bacterium]
MNSAARRVVFQALALTGLVAWLWAFSIWDWDQGIVRGVLLAIGLAAVAFIGFRPVANKSGELPGWVSK